MTWYTITYDREAKEYIARSTEHPSLIGTGDTKKEAINELAIFLREYKKVYELSRML